MSSPDRRAAGRRRTPGRGPAHPRLEALEGRALMAAHGGALPDLVNSAIAVSTGTTDWGNGIEIQGRVTNQGGSATTTAFPVILYASPVRGVNRLSVEIGQVAIPAGLAPGQSIPYQLSASLPETPVPSVNSNGGTVYVAAWVDPNRVVAESNYHNNRDVGPPYDSTPITISPPKPAELVGTTLAVSSPTTTWGSTVTVTAQVTNKGSGASPPTTALLSLTPQGQSFGGTTSVGVGTIPIPALAPYQTYNVAENITLPAVEPLAITNYTNFGLTMVQDANYLTNQLYPNQPDQGIGLDQAAMTITTSPTSTATTGPLPDLAASSVVAASGTIRWGQSFQASTTVQNLGQGAAGSFQVFFILTGQAGSVNNGIYLGQTTISGLAAGASQPIDQTLTLPNRLPAGVNLNSVGYGRVAVVVDPNNMVNETLKTNNEAVSAPFIVRLPGNASTVPTQATPGAIPSVQTIAQQTRARERAAAVARRIGRVDSLVGVGHPIKLHRHAAPPTNTIVSTGLSLANELTRLPHQVVSVVGKSL